MSGPTKITAARLPLRKSGAGSLAASGGFPAWIDAEQGLAFSVARPVHVSSRVRDGLVLRVVTSHQPGRLRPSTHVRASR